MIWDTPLEQVFEVVLVESTQGFGRDAITGSVSVFRDRRLEPTLFNPAHDFAATHVQCLSKRFQREAVAANVPDAQLPPLEGVTKSFCASVQFLRDFLHRVFREQFPRLVQFFLLPATVIDFCLDAVLDDESPAFFLCAAGLTLEPANELGKFVSRKHPSLFRQGDCFRIPSMRKSW